MASRDTISMPPGKPVVIYDGTCDFCRRRVARRQNVAGTRIDFVPSAEAEQRLPAVARLPLNESVHLIERSGRISEGAQAVLRIRKIAAGRSRLLWLYHKLPAFRHVAEFAYRQVARHRRHFGTSHAGKT